jgi:hypothetical protein
MFGYFDEPTINPDHKVSVSLNNTFIGETTWDGLSWHEAFITFNANVLIPGENSLVITLPANSGVEFDRVAFDWVELTYPNTFLAEGDQLSYQIENPITESQSSGVIVSGFSTSDIRVFDVSDPWSVVPLTNILIESPESFYQVQYEDIIPASSAIDYWALGATAIQSVASVEKDQFVDLVEFASGAEHLVISHEVFVDQAQRLTTLRNSQGLSSVTIDIQDVYDQFNYGIVDPLAIREFLSFAYDNWGASYVVLVGDGHYDPKQNKFTETESFIPPYLADADPWLGETAADNWYVSLSGSDAMPEMMLGRIAVSTINEAQNFIDKIVDFESETGDWQYQVLAVADNQESGDPPFAGISEDLLNDYLPPSYQVEKVYLGDTHSTGNLAKQAIIASINTGKMFVNYFGHGNTSIWADEPIFSRSDVSILENVGKYPIFLTMTCNNGYYLYPRIPEGYRSLAETLTNASERGAAASWSPTAFGRTNGHDFLIKGFYEAVFEDGVEHIGEATLLGKLNLWASGNNLDLLDTFLLFGDPATRFPSYLASPTNLTATSVGFDQIDLTWTDNSDNESTFLIERSLNGLDGWVLIDTVGENITTYNDLGLDPDTTYYYRVRAYRNGDDVYSEYTNIDDARTEQALFFFLPLIVVQGP